MDLWSYSPHTDVAAAYLDGEVGCQCRVCVGAPAEPLQCTHLLHLRKAEVAPVSGECLRSSASHTLTPLWFLIGDYWDYFAKAVSIVGVDIH